MTSLNTSEMAQKSSDNFKWLEDLSNDSEALKSHINLNTILFDLVDNEVIIHPNVECFLIRYPGVIEIKLMSLQRIAILHEHRNVHEFQLWELNLIDRFKELFNEMDPTDHFHFVLESEYEPKELKLVSKNENIFELLQTVDITPHISEDYDEPPYIYKGTWQRLGNYVSGVEKTLVSASSNEYITLRLDIRGMSKIKRALIRLGIFKDKYDQNFSDIMVDTMIMLMKEFGAQFGYTQSDEITLIIYAMKNPLSKYIFDGRRDKFVSISASLASSFLNRRLQELQQILYEDSQIEKPGCWQRFLSTVGWRPLPQKPTNPTHLPILTFDSRMGVFKTAEDAFSLILWRVYDCGVNGLSSAVYNLRKKSLSSHEKIKYLSDNNLLPIPRDQAYGVLYSKVTVPIKTINVATNEPIEVERKEYRWVEHLNILNLVREKGLSILSTTPIYKPLICLNKATEQTIETITTRTFPVGFEEDILHDKKNQ